MALATAVTIADNPTRYYRQVRSGTRTAADFTVELGFAPFKVEVTNLTDKISGTWHSTVPTPNALQLKAVAAGTRTYEDCGISVTGRTLTVTIATATLETNDDVTLIEAWG